MIEVSEDEEMLTPPGALSATVAEMQAKNDTLQYHTNAKITILSMAAERLDSTVLH